MTATSEPFACWTEDVAQVERELKRWRSGALHIARAEVQHLFTAGHPAVMPVVTVKPRCDVSDLIRRHHPLLDGDGEARYDWRFLLAAPKQSRAIVRCTFREPARCVFALEFAIFDCLALLQRCCTLDTLLLTTTTTRDPLTSGIALSGIAVPELRSVMRAAEIINHLCER